MLIAALTRVATVLNATAVILFHKSGAASAEPVTYVKTCVMNVLYSFKKVFCVKIALQTMKVIAPNAVGVTLKYRVGARNVCCIQTVFLPVSIAPLKREKSSVRNVLFQKVSIAPNVTNVTATAAE